MSTSVVLPDLSPIKPFQPGGAEVLADALKVPFRAYAPHVFSNSANGFGCCCLFLRLLTADFDESLGSSKFFFVVQTIEKGRIPMFISESGEIQYTRMTYWQLNVWQGLRMQLDDFI